MKAAAVAHANIALVKYWGKKDEDRIIPEAASLSIALDGLATTTKVELGDFEKDTLTVDGVEADPSRARAVLDALSIQKRARIESTNDFPSASGLASSASGYAALAAAAAAASGEKRAPAALSAAARHGSGSAARSVPGGWAVWSGESASSVFPPEHWDLRFVVAIAAGDHKKELSSRDGMRRTRETSPYHAAWIEQCKKDLNEALKRLKAKDLFGLGEIAESNSLRMHADAMAADPPLLYWKPETLACLQALRELRSQGVLAWGTIDAGPHVVALCTPADAPRVEKALAPHVGRVMVCKPAGGARVL